MSRRAVERIEQAFVIARMQADGRFVEHVEHAAQLGTDLRGEADALGFAAGERGGGAVETQIMQPDGFEKFEAAADLVDDPSGDLCLTRRQFPGSRCDPGRARAAWR